MSVKKEEKFFVLKMEDIEDYFARYQDGYFMNDEGTKLHQAWDTVIKGICEMRKTYGKPAFNNYIVCNQDEPYAELVWQIILLGEKAKQKKDVQNES